MGDKMSEENKLYSANISAMTCLTKMLQFVNIDNFMSNDEAEEMLLKTLEELTQAAADHRRYF